MGGKLIILIGPPAAGKSTWRQQFRGEVICPDDIRRELFGVQYDPRVEPLVWRLAYKRLARALAAGKEVCFDATNLTRARRRPLIKIGKEADATIEALVFLRDLRELLERDARRPPGKRVGEKVLKAKYAQLEMPTREEGFDQLTVIR
ncbi:MAG: AAA family ATPase [Bacillota bacterium]